GFFGGEGFIMQKISGSGIAFAEFDGHVVEYELHSGERLVIDTGHLAAMSASCHMDIQTVPGLKNKFLGGEGFFNTVVTGPGKVWLQTMPIPNVAGALRPYIPTGNS
ncbi:AIM24 family protein, partial [bacterium 1XD42-8]